MDYFSFVAHASSCFHDAVVEFVDDNQAFGNSNPLDTLSNITDTLLVSHIGRYEIWISSHILQASSTLKVLRVLHVYWHAHHTLRTLHTHHWRDVRWHLRYIRHISILNRWIDTTHTNILVHALFMWILDILPMLSLHLMPRSFMFVGSLFRMTLINLTMIRLFLVGIARVLFVLFFGLIMLSILLSVARSLVGHRHINDVNVFGISFLSKRERTSELTSLGLERLIFLFFAS
jgi:hypothetical protein